MSDYPQLAEPAERELVERAVSYTHLDVYKRQAFALIAASSTS